jgi:histone H3/H4
MSEKSANDVELSKRNVKNIMHGVNSRVSGDAATHMAFMLEERVVNITRSAQVIAQAAGRQTIKEDDIRKAMRVNEIMEGSE